MAEIASAFGQRGVVINGLSKSHCMTGWRVGYAAGPREIISIMNAIQSQSVTSTSTISQWAAVAALSGDQSFIAANNARYRKRRDRLVERLNGIVGLECLVPEGAFYAYPNCGGLLGRRTPEGETLRSDADVAPYLLKQVGVAMVHGGAFGLSPYLRLSFATSDDLLDKAADRIGDACAALT